MLVEFQLSRLNLTGRLYLYSAFVPPGSTPSIPEQEDGLMFLGRDLAASILDMSDPERTPTMPHPLRHPPQSSFTPSGFFSQVDPASATGSFPHSGGWEHPQGTHLALSGFDPRHTQDNWLGHNSAPPSSLILAGTTYFPTPMAESRLSLSTSMPENRDGLYPGEYSLFIGGYVKS